MKFFWKRRTGLESIDGNRVFSAMLWQHFISLRGEKMSGRLFDYSR
jgi:hypothetical protein